ncbi:MAG: outer membrane protein assembly factor BamD, partial [Planctomycetota bacterium]|nr:outer membrane protein assembly factor BamD [Planctomycetota bacterium]
MHCRTRLILLLAVLGVAAWLHTGACGGEDFDFRRAHGFYALMEYKDATEAFEKYLADFPKSERADQARLLLAESYYQLKQYPEAATAYACFIKEYPTSPRRTDALLRAAKVNFVIKKPEASLSAAETFLKENRAHLGAAGAPEQLPQQVATALYYAGEASLALKNAAQARTYWEELLKSYPDSKLAPDAGEGLGWIHFDAKEYEQALARFKLTAAAPGHPRAAWSKLMEGRTLAALKKTDDALAAFKAAPGLGGSTKELEAESAMRTAEALAGAERLPDALNAYKRLAGAFPDAAVTLPALGVGALAWMEAQHQAEALALADLYLKIGAAAPDRPAILRLRARALAALSDEAEA